MCGQLSDHKFGHSQIQGDNAETVNNSVGEDSN